MRKAASWVLLRAVLYVLVAILGLPAAGFIYSAVTGVGIAGNRGDSWADLAAWLGIGLGVAIMGGSLTLIVLAILAPFRSKVSSVEVSGVLSLFLLLPVLFLDLAGTSPSFTLLLLGAQITYLVLVPLISRRARDEP